MMDLIIRFEWLLRADGVGYPMIWIHDWAEGPEDPAWEIAKYAAVWVSRIWQLINSFRQQREADQSRQWQCDFGVEGVNTCTIR